MASREEPLAASDLRDRLRERALRYSYGPKAAAAGLPAGFQHVDDVILLLQPLRTNADDNEEALLAILRRLAEKNFLTGTQAIGEGGLWAALVQGCIAHRRGFHTELSESEAGSAAEALLGERAACALVSTRPKAHLPLANFVERDGRFTAEAIGRVTTGDIRVRWMGDIVFEAS